MLRCGTLILHFTGDLLKLLEFSSAESILLMTYGKLHPPLGKHRLKVVSFTGAMSLSSISDLQISHCATFFVNIYVICMSQRKNLGLSLFSGIF